MTLIETITKYLHDKFVKVGFAPPEKPVLEAKNSDDFTLTPSSGQWFVDEYCAHCHNHVYHAERMAEICNSCGTHGNRRDFLHKRSFRRIWNGEQWLFQIRFPFYFKNKKDYVILSEACVRKVFHDYEHGLFMNNGIKMFLEKEKLTLADIRKNETK